MCVCVEESCPEYGMRRFTCTSVFSMCLCMQTSAEAKTIWKHGRCFLHLFTPSALSASYIAVGRKGGGGGCRVGMENKKRTLNGFLRHAVWKDAART